MARNGAQESRTTAAVGDARNAQGPPADGEFQAAGRVADAGVQLDVFSRLAELWAELATLDPEVAKRLPTYEA